MRIDFTHISIIKTRKIYKKRNQEIGKSQQKLILFPSFYSQYIKRKNLYFISNHHFDNYFLPISSPSPSSIPSLFLPFLIISCFQSFIIPNDQPQGQLYLSKINLLLDYIKQMRSRIYQFGKRSRSEEKPPSYDLFEDEKNPIFGEKDEVTELFKRMHGCALERKPMDIELPFKIEKTITAQCSKVLQNSFFYKCLDCQKHKYACVCEECFNEGDHRGHRIERRYADYFGGTCDCGNSDIWKSSGFCKYHKGESFNEEKGNLPDQQFKTVFVHYFQRLFQMLFYLYEEHSLSQWTSKIHTFIYQKLIQLNRNSSFYIEATYTFLDEAKFQNGKTLLDNIINLYSLKFDGKVFQFLNGLIVKEKCAYLIIKKYIQISHNNQQALKEGLNPDLLFQLFAYKDVLQKLAENEEEIFYSKTPYSFVMRKLFKHFESQKEEETRYYWKVFIENGGIEIHHQLLKESNNIGKLISCIKDDEKLFGFVIKDVVEKQQSIETGREIFFKLLVGRCGGSLQNYQKSYVFLQKSEIGVQKISVLMKKFIQNLNEEEGSTIILGLLFLIQYPQFQNNFIEWLPLQRNPESNVITLLRWVLNVISTVSDKCLLYDSLSQFSHVINEQEYAEVIKEYIYEVREDIYFFKKKFQFYPHLLSKVIKEHCKVDLRGKVTHNLQSQCEYPPLRILFPTYQNIQISTKIKNLLPYQKQLFSIIFNGEFQKKFQTSLQHLSSLENPPYNLNKVKYEYCRFIIFFNLVLPSSSFFQQLKYKLLNEKKYRDELFPVEKEREEILKMFEMEGENEAMEKEKQELRKRKEKLQQLKKRKLVKMKEKQKKILQQNPQQKEQRGENGQKDEVICILCHENADKNDNLFYFGYLKNQKFINSFILPTSFSFFNIQFCPHYIHQACYLANYKEFDSIIKCPLCKTLSNVILPSFKWKMEEENFWEQKMELMYEIEGQCSSVKTVSILLRHLMYAKGIELLYFASVKMRRKKYEQAEKTSSHILSLLQYCQQERLKEEIVKIQSQLKKQNVVELILFITLQAIRQRLTHQPFKHQGYSLLSNLQQKLCLQQLTVFIKNIQSILNEKQKEGGKSIFVNSSIDCHLPETASQFLKEKSQQCKHCNLYENDVWECVLCGESSCRKCSRKEHHSGLKHGGLCLFISYRNAQVILLKNDSYCSGNLYGNEMQEGWTSMQSPEGYTLAKERLGLFMKAYKCNDMDVIKEESHWVPDDSEDW